MHIDLYQLNNSGHRDQSRFYNTLKSLYERELILEGCLFNFESQLYIFLVSESRLNSELLFHENLKFNHKDVNHFTHGNALSELWKYLLQTNGFPPDGKKAGTKIYNDLINGMQQGISGAICRRVVDSAFDYIADLRKVSDIASGALTPMSATYELSHRILDNLSKATLTVLGTGAEFQRFVKYWSQKDVGKLIVLSPDFRETEQLAQISQLIPCRWEERHDVLSRSDIIIFSQHIRDVVINREFINKNLQRRRRRSLLLFNWTDTLFFERGIDKESAVFDYSKHDINELIEQTQQKRESIVSNHPEILEARIEEFMEWLYSEERYVFQGMVGKSQSMQKVFELIRRVSDTDITILISGETGTGKEMVAHAIHNESKRAAGPFIPVNCGAIPETLLESELFGHRKGAFTGAENNRKGLLREAAGGTVFLDEIGDTSQIFQVKLLRALQEREITPLGSNLPEPINVRIIAATAKNLDKEIERGNFRTDLYYRINVVKIKIPSLRDRKTDILPLCKFFIRKYNHRMGKRVNAISEKVLSLLKAHDWKGNVRELENVIEHAVALSFGNEITAADIPDNILLKKRQNGLKETAQIKTLEELEQEYISKLLQEYEGNYAEVARKLGIGRTTLWRKMKKYGLERNE